MINIINNLKDREELIEKIDTLEKVKNLLLIPGTDFTTLNGVANYYEVSPETIYGVVKRHREELVADGMTQIKKTDFIVKFYNEQYVNYKTHMTKSSFSAILPNGDVYTFTNKGVLIFNRRSILRIGMLLTQSKIAEELRTQLLNIEEQTNCLDNYSVDIDNVGETLTFAFINKDIHGFATEFMKLNNLMFKNKDATIKALTDENNRLKEENIKLKNHIDTFMCKNK